MTTRPTSIVSGVTTVLQCSTNPCYPNATIIWTHNNINITTGVTTDTEYINGSGVITRSNLTRSYTWADRGQQIVCAATSDGTTKSSQPLQLVIWVQVTMVTFLNTSSQNEKIETSEGSITLICVTSPSNPAPSVSWYKNGQQINSGVTDTPEQKPDGLTVTTSSLSLTVYRSDDGHAVYCTAGIPGQTTPVTSNTGILDVWYGPSQNGVIVEFSNSQAAVEGRSLTLKCSTNSAVKPNVDFTWKFSDGTEVIGSRGDKQGSSGSTWSQTLTLTPSKADNRQIVRCTVKNTATQAESTGQKNLEVKYPPSESPAISGTVFPVLEGDVITLHCSTTGGNPKPNLTWFCPGGSTSCSNTDSGETRTCTISFTANRRQNNVDCVCTPSWRYGGYTESKSRKMIIHYAPDTPSLSSVPSQPWLEHRSASLNCSLTDQGNPVAKFYWIRNNNDIEHTGFNYTFTPSKEDNGDEYKCTAGNLFTDRDGQSRPESNTVQLNVYYSPRIQITLSTHDFRKEGDDLTLTCTADSNPSPSSLTWMFGGQTVGHDGSLRLTNLSREEHGQYTCEARVSAGRYGNLVNSSDVQVVVNYAPDTPSLSSVPSQPWLEHRSASLNCSLTDQGNPVAKFYWIRNNNGVEHTGFNYTFTPSKEDNGDEYRCTAGNLFTDRDGQSRPESNAVQLNVYYSPRVVISSGKHTRVELGKLLILRCSADSNPATPKFEWTRSSTHLADGPVLQIAAFRYSDQGEYTCSATTVSDRYGSLTGSASVIVTVLEAAPDSCYCTDQKETSMDLEWNYDRTDTSNRFSVEQRLSKNTHWDIVSTLPTQRENNTFILYVSDLKSNSSYYFKIFSSSNKDDSSFCLTKCRTLPFSKNHEPVLESSMSGLGLGVAVGLVVGLVVTSVAAVLINLILLRKGFLVRSESKRQKETSVYQDITMDTVQQTSGSDTTRMPNESTNTYDSLQSHDATPYEKLNAYENLPPSGEMSENTAN